MGAALGVPKSARRTRSCTMRGENATGEGGRASRHRPCVISVNRKARSRVSLDAPNLLLAYGLEAPFCTEGEQQLTLNR